MRAQAKVHWDAEDRHADVDVTPFFSLRENAIAKEPGSSYPERWRWVSRLGASLVAQTPSSLPVWDPEPGRFSASSLVTPTRWPLPGPVVPVCNSDP